jgi:phosphatidylinositol-3-phosphatase
MLVRCLVAFLIIIALAVPNALRARAAAPAFSHLYVIMEENTSYEDIVGNTADAPYINSLIQTDGFAANYYGVTHPSLPNYVAAIAGDYFGSQSDSPTQVFSHPSIVDQLESGGLTWAAYMQSLPSVGFTGSSYPTSGSGLYVSKHDPFVLMQDIVSNAARLQNIKPIESLSTDLASGTAPNYSFISPDVCHDMHGASSTSSNLYGEPWCAYPPTNQIAHTLIQAGDQYLKQLVTTITTSKAWTTDSAIVVTWDENDFAGSTGNGGYASDTGCCGSPLGQGGGRVPAIVITGHPSHTVSLHPYNHYSLLRTIEDNFGLPCLAHTCDASVQSMTDLLQGTASSTPVAFTQGFSVTFSSANPGQGMVLFGSGPKCLGLVEVGTRDFGAGTTTHTVLVTGNDLPGTVGDIGLTPGATYSFEVITVTKSGVEVDNNGGSCYSVTISKP